MAFDPLTINDICKRCGSLLIIELSVSFWLGGPDLGLSGS